MTAFAKGNSQYLKYEYKVSILSFVYSILIQSRVQQNSKLEFQMRAHITRKVKTAVCNIIETSYFRKRGNMKFIAHLQKVQRAKRCPRHQKLSYIKTVIVGPKYLVIHTFAPFLHTCSSSSTHTEYVWNCHQYISAKHFLCVFLHSKTAYGLVSTRNINSPMANRKMKYICVKDLYIYVLYRQVFIVILYLMLHLSTRTSTKFLFL